MKRKLRLISGVMSCVMLGSVMLSATSCDLLQGVLDGLLGNSTSEQPIGHQHTMQEIEGKEASCTEEGNTAYWTCEGCEKIFADAQGKEEITLADTVIAAKGHTLAKTEAKDASCDEGGNLEYWACEVCGELFADEKGEASTTLADVTLHMTGHKMTKTEGKEATCEEAGRLEYWTCDACGKLFADADGTTETTLDALTVAPAHNMVHYEAVAVSWAADGHVEYWQCSHCGKYFADEKGETEYTAEEIVIAREALPTGGVDVGTDIKGTTSFWKVTPGSTGTSFNNGWYTFGKGKGTYEGEIGLPELKTTEEGAQYLEFTKASRFELFHVHDEEKNNYVHLADNSTWNNDAHSWLYDKTFVYDFDVTATGKFSFEIFGMAGAMPDQATKNGMTLIFEGNTVSLKSSNDVTAPVYIQATATLPETFDFGDGQHHHISLSVNRYSHDNGTLKLYVDGYMVCFVKSNAEEVANSKITPNADGSIANGNAGGLGQRFSVIPEKAEGAETFSTVCIYGLTISRFGGEQAEIETPAE